MNAEEQEECFMIRIGTIEHICKVPVRFSESLNVALGHVDKLFKAAELLQKHGERKSK